MPYAAAPGSHAVRALGLLLLALLIAGCTQPQNEPAAEDGPIDLGARTGLLLVDLETRSVAVLSTSARGAWISPSGAYVAWSEPAYGVVQTPDRGRLVAPSGTWARIHDNGTGLELVPGEARFRDLVTHDVVANASLPPAPRAGSAWTRASEDLAVLAVEYPAAEAAGACRDEIAIRATEGVLFQGCHLAVASDGRVGWTTGPEVRLRHPDGTVENVTASEGATNENPVFTDEGLAYLRVHGADTHVVLRAADESVVARAASPQRLALLGATEDGRYLLVSSFRA